MDGLSSLLLLYIFSRGKMFDLGREGYLRPIAERTNGQLYCRVQSAPQVSNPNNQGLSQKQEAGEGKWTLLQEMKYLLFLQEFQPDFSTPEGRKRALVFANMSKRIATRSTAQCKSHHQKKLKTHGSVRGIIEELTREFSHLTMEWQELRRRQPRVLVKRYEEINSSQSFYRVLGFTDCLKIEIKTSSMKSF